MNNPILTKQTKTGQTLEIFPAGAPKHFECRLDGKVVASSYIEPLQKAQGEVTHHIGRKVALTDAEVATLRASLPVDYAAQRRALVLAYYAALDTLDTEHSRMMASDGGYSPRDTRPQIEAAAAALQAFDREHPEVAAAIQAESLRRFEAAD